MTEKSLLKDYECGTISLSTKRVAYELTSGEKSIEKKFVNLQLAKSVSEGINELCADCPNCNTRFYHEESPIDMSIYSGVKVTCMTAPHCERQPVFSDSTEKRALIVEHDLEVAEKHRNENYGSW